MSDIIQVNTSSDKKETLQQIARQLVDAKLAACIQVSGPVESVYRWGGEIQTATEWTCSIKTIQKNFSRVEATIRKIHHYDEPEIIACQIVDGSESYLAWIRECSIG